jgi:hypothetical protein
MRILAILTLVMTCFAFNAQAWNCEKIEKRQKRKCGKKPNSRRCKKLTGKLNACKESGGDKSAAKSAWKSSGKSAFKEDWKANKKTYKSSRKCDRILRRRDRVCEKKGAEHKRCIKLTKKAEDKGCNGDAASDG